MYSLILLLLFLAVMICVGIWGMRKTTTLNDFFLGGRSVGPWMSAFAYGTTYFSASVFIGFAGKQGWGFGPSALLIADSGGHRNRNFKYECYHPGKGRGKSKGTGRNSNLESWQNLL